MRSLPSTRREFFHYGAKGLGLLAFSHYAPHFLTSSTLANVPRAEKDRSILVLIQLAGGNDGLNTVVPFNDPTYHHLRPELALKENQVLPISDTLGLHPSCGPLDRLLKDGKLSILQSVGYPNPNRSHFRSMEIWETASESDQFLHNGWIGRFFDNQCGGIPSDESPLAVHTGHQVPQAFLADNPHNTFGLSLAAGGGRRGGGGNRSGDIDLLEALAARENSEDNTNTGFLRHTMMDALVTERRVQDIVNNYRPGTNYPGTPLAQSLRNIASLIAAGMETRIYFASLGGFDTHGNQLNTHANLLRTLSEAMQAFQRDLEAHQLADQVLTMTFSEFGRRPYENESRGTDHGTAAPLFVMGSHIQAGILGAQPEIPVDRRREIPHSIDFRQVYATMLEKWLGCPSHEILGGKEFKTLSFV